MPLSDPIMVVTTLAVCEVFQMRVFKPGHVYCLKYPFMLQCFSYSVRGRLKLQYA